MVFVVAETVFPAVRLSDFMLHAPDALFPPSVDPVPVMLTWLVMVSWSAALFG